ncbi:MAG: hypothetical protein JWO44_66 [Bacteroidetes bacterium]|jgi:hypothetical protein|nr:hypothetical protein [Bacteroidota bacterium]
MTNFREKAQVFIIGLSIGLLIAGAFFILKLDDYFKELNLYKKVSQSFSSTEQASESTEKTEQPEKQEKKQNQKPSKNKTAVYSDSAAAPEKKELVPDADTLRMKGDSAIAIMAAEDDIVVRKDEQLMTRTLDVYNLNPTASKQSSKDSLLQKVSGIKDDKAGSKQMFNIELWASPLNYKGYKMSKYKIVLYGIQSLDNVKLYKLDDVIYLKSAAMVYRLDYASDFKQYERITDEQITNKLK